MQIRGTREVRNAGCGDLPVNAPHASPNCQTLHVSEPLLPARPIAVDAASIFDEADIVIDSTVLLSLYRLSAGTRDSWYQVLDLVAGRLVMPHQVAVEFTRNADTSRSEIVTSYARLLGAVHSLRALPKELFTGGRHLQADRIKHLGDLIQKHLDPLVDALTESRDGDSAIVEAANDVVLAKVASLFESRIMPEPDPRTIRERVTEFVTYRAPNQVPPGWKDLAKPTPLRQAGDYLLWAEVLDHAASAHRPVILVTDDGKDDWWLKANGTMEPAPELAVEFGRVTQQAYAQVTSVKFFEFARAALGLDEDADALEETAEVVAAEQVAREASAALAVLNPDVLRAIQDIAITNFALPTDALSSVRLGVLSAIQATGADSAFTGLNPATLRAIQDVASSYSSLSAVDGLNSIVLSGMREVGANSAFTGLNPTVLRAIQDVASTYSTLPTDALSSVGLGVLSARQAAGFNSAFTGLNPAAKRAILDVASTYSSLSTGAVDGLNSTVLSAMQNAARINAATSDLEQSKSDPDVADDAGDDERR